MKLPPYPNYKPSGVEWLGEVPEHWGVVPVYARYHVDLGKMLNEARISGDHLVRYLRNVDVQWDRIEVDDLPEMDIAPHELERFTVKRGDLLVCEGGDVGRAAIVSKETDGLGYQKALHRLRPTCADAVPRFMFYILRWASSQGVFVAGGNPNTIPHLTGEKLRRHRFPCPPRVEQRAIADFLDRETEMIDTLVARKRTLIERLKEKRFAFISRTVTRGLPPEAATQAGLDPHPNLKPSGIDWLGDVPEHWGVDRLKWTTEGVINGVWGDEPNDVDDLICVRVADFDRERLSVHESPPTLRAIHPQHRDGRLLHRGDLLVEKSGGGDKQLVGCVVLFDHEFDAVCSNFVARMPIARNQQPRFWIYAHAALYAGRVNYPSIKQTTGIQNLDSSDYLDTRVAFPPEPEQCAIADFLERETAKIDQMAARVDAAIERLQEYRIALITAAVTGKIDIRGTTA